jgi:PAS domain S-box-containing protein
MELPMEKRVTPESLKLALELFLELIPRIMTDSDYNPLRTLELEYYCKDGTILWTENKLSGIRDENGKPVSILAEVRDITERKQAEEKLRKSEENFRRSLDDSSLGVRIVTAEGETLYANQAALEIYGYDSIEELKRTPLKEHYTPESYVDFQIRKEKRGRGEFGPSEYEISIVRKNGEIRHIQVFRKEVIWNGARQFQIIYHDITKRQQAEELLRRSEEKYRNIIETMQEGYFENDLAGNFTFVNDAECRNLGYPKEELIGMNNRRYQDETNAQKTYQLFKRLFRTGEPVKAVDVEIIRKNGMKGFNEASVSLIRDAEGKPIGFRGISRDVTERKQAENSLQESEERYKALFDRSLDLVYITDFEGRFIDANAVALNRLGYTREEIHSLNIASLLSEDQLPLAVKTIQEIRETGAQKFPTEFRLLHKDGTRVYVETKGSIVMSNGTPVAIQSIARDVTERKQAEEERKQSFERMRKALGATVHSISVIVEMKDPYTSGHQQRVSDLARSIATEMGLSADQRDFIRTASAIHDIGKISIPSEILSKPTRLTALEFNLIKTHAQSGYDILKDIEFPWPVADVVLQHHERIDGSGYPQGLKGDDIPLEARIIAVADVVEAIASHRPYRPALGIEAALEEIEKNKGILYDNTIADACLRLFREKSYQLP